MKRLMLNWIDRNLLDYRGSITSNIDDITDLKKRIRYLNFAIENPRPKIGVPDINGDVIIDVNYKVFEARHSNGYEAWEVKTFNKITDRIKTKVYF